MKLWKRQPKPTTGPQQGPPPSKADPDIVGNAEGNRRLLRKDREAVRRAREGDR